MEDYEDKVSGFLDYGESTAPPFTAESIIGGARRRRARHRTAVAGSSLAVLAVAAGAVVLSGGQARTLNVGPGEGASPSATPSAANDNLEQDILNRLGPGVVTIASGTHDGHTWKIQGKVAPTGKTLFADESCVPTTDVPNGPQLVLVESEDGVPMAATQMDPKAVYNGSLPLDVSPMPGIEAGKTTSAQFAGAVDPRIDHFELYYKDHSQELPVVRIDGASVAGLVIEAHDLPQTVTAYDAAGNLIGQAKAPEPQDMMAEDFGSPSSTRTPITVTGTPTIWTGGITGTGCTAPTEVPMATGTLTSTPDK